MKKLALAAALSFGTTSAFAGGYAPPVVEPEPVMEPQVVVEETAGTSGGIVVPLLLLAVVAAVATAN